MIKAVIFDMDGTTVDTINSIAFFANKALKKFGILPVPTENYFTFIGDGPKKLIERLIDFSGGDLSKTDEVLNFYLEEYNNNSLYLTKPYDGIIEMLEGLKKQGIKTAILSNKQDEAVKIIGKELFGDLIELSVGSCKNVARKPAPDSLFNVMDILGVSKDQVLFVGDTNVDIFTAKNAGVKSIGVLWGFRDEKELTDAGADFIVSHPKEILDVIMKNE